MNKEEFIQKLSEKTGYSLDQCGVVNEVLEKFMVVGKENRDKILEELKSRLNLPDEALDNIYNAAMGLLGGGLMDKIKGFFGK